MPYWLRVVPHCNPLTYEVDALRALMIIVAKIVYGLGIDFLILIMVKVVLVAVGGWLYPNVVR